MNQLVILGKEWSRYQISHYNWFGLTRKLVLVEENVKHLHYIKGSVVVVVVVGKFHSGKSFLFNQLMGKQHGFGIGPSVRPQTMGIWMWGKVMIL